MMVYTIQPGDSLYQIARRFGTTVERLVEANGVDPNKYLVIGDSLVIPAPVGQRPAFIVNGYAYPFIDRNNLMRALPDLTYLSLFSTGITEEGGLIPLKMEEEAIRLARSQNTVPLLVLTSIDETGGFSGERAARFLDNAAAWPVLIEALKRTLNERNYGGVDVDFEYLPPRLAATYAEFINRLRQELAPKPVFVALAPKKSSEQRGLLYEAHDYAALGAAASGVLVMTYEWGYTYGPPMAVAPLDQVTEVLEYAVSQIPANKILMGLPNYGYDWMLPYEEGRPARSIGNYEAIALARKYGAEIQFDEKAQSPWFRYYDNRGNQHEVWFEDARSYQAKLRLAQRLGLKGVSIWNIMRWFRPLYTLLNGMFEIQKF